MKRHTANHKPEDAENHRSKRPRTVRPSRVTQACEACAEVHLRCENEKPCSRCKKKQIPCIFTGTAIHEVEAISAAEDLLGLANHRAAAITNAQQAPLVSQLPSREHGIQDGMNQESQMETANQYQEAFSHDDPTQLNLDPPPPPLDDTSYHALSSNTDDWGVPDFLRNMPSNSDPLLSGTWTPRGFGFDTNLDLNDIDLTFLDKYNAHIPFDQETPQSETNSRIDNTSQMPHEGVAIRAEAFKRSVWRYTPNSSQHHSGTAEQANLAVLHGDHGSPESRITLPRRASTEQLDRISRDKILALVLNTCKPTNIPQTVAAFPSVELLDSLIQFYLTSSTARADEWIHVPSLSPTSKQNPAFWAAIIAAGAVLTPDASLRKLGFAIQEACRLTLAEQMEDDNTAIRDMQVQQAFIVQLEIGFWSGISRKMEIAESFINPILTMVRRGGKLRHSAYTKPYATADDGGDILEQKWRSWVNQESYIRLVFRLFEFDALCSLALLKRPLIGYSEMQLPMPEAGDLWSAPNAMSWKRIIITSSYEANKTPTLLDCMNNLENISINRSLAECETSSLAFLYAAWSLIWEYHQLQSVIKPNSRQWNDSLIMTSRHQELVKLLEDFRINSDVIARQSSRKVSTILQLLCVHLYVSLEDVQLFAGLEGQEEARRVYPLLKEWATTQAARQAVWHAGQLLREVRRLPRGKLRDFSAIALYHASLVFWAFGVLRGSDNSTADISAIVCVDGPETMDIRRFITLDKGSPSLRGENPSSAVVHLHDTVSAVDFLINVLRDNHGATADLAPPLVANLMQLMEGLRAAVR